MARPIDSAIEVKVEALDSDIRKIEDSILGLDAKIEKSIADFSREVRAAIQTLSTQFTERERAWADSWEKRQRTPWVAIAAIVGVIITILAAFGNQALSPIFAELKEITVQMVPRSELDARRDSMNRRLDLIEADIRRSEERLFNGRERTLERLIEENKELRSKIK